MGPVRGLEPQGPLVTDFDGLFAVVQYLVSHRSSYGLPSSVSQSVFDLSASIAAVIGFVLAAISIAMPGWSIKAVRRCPLSVKSALPLRPWNWNVRPAGAFQSSGDRVPIGLWM